MKLSHEQIRVAAAILYRARTSAEAKLQWGVQKRAENRSREKNGEKVRNYRTDWVLETQRRVCEVLLVQAQALAAAHPHDCVSTLDFEDVLNRVLNQIRDAAAREHRKKQQD